MRQRPLFTVLCVAGTIASGVFLSGQVGPAPARPSLVTLDKADAAKLAAAGRAAVQVEMPAGVELKLWAPDGLIADPVALEVTPDGTVYVAGTQRNNLPLDIRGHQDWMTTAHTMKTVADLRRFYTDVMSPANSAKNGWIPDANGDGSKDIRDLAEFKERVYRVLDTDGDGIADKSQIVYEGFNDDPTWDTIGGVLSDGKDLVVVVPPGVYRLRDAKGDGRFNQRNTIAEGMNIHPAFGGHGVSGVLMGPDGRLYWEVGDIGLHVTDRNGKIWSYPNQGAVMRSDPDGSNFEVFATGIRNLQEFSFDEHGNLISVDNDGDYPSEQERVVYLPWGSETGLALDVAVRQVHRPEEQPLQRLDRRAGLQAALRGPHRTGAAADRQLARRAVGHGLQPGHRAVRGLEEPFLRHQLRRLGVDGARLRVHARGEGRRLRDGAGADAAQGHPRRRPAHRSGRGALRHRLDHGLGFEEQGPHLEARHARDGQQRDPQGRPHAARRRFREGRHAGDRAAPVARGHARPAEGAVRPRAPR